MTRTYRCSSVITLQATLLPALSAPTPRRGNLSISPSRRAAQGPYFPEDAPNPVVSDPQGLQPRPGLLKPHARASARGAAYPPPRRSANPNAPLRVFAPRRRCSNSESSGFPSSNLTVSNCEEEVKTAAGIGREPQQPAV